MPDWGDMKHPWLYDLMIPGGFSFGPATIFETTLPDYSFPVWLPGDYQICAELVDSATGEPLGPFAMAGFGVNRGLVELLFDRTNWILDVETLGDEIWAAGPGGVVRWWKEADQWEYERFSRFDGISDTYVSGIYPDEFGNLIMWPFVGNGITVFDGQSFTNFFEDQILYVTGMVMDRDMNMWATAMNGGMFMVSRHGEIKWGAELGAFPASMTGRGIALNNDGYPVAVISDDETDDWLLCTYDGENWWTTPFPFDWLDENGQAMMKYMWCMAVDMNDHIWFGTLSGALEWDGSTLIRHTPDNSGLAGYSVSEIKLDSIGRIWFVCWSPVQGYGGLCFYDGQSWGTMPGLDYPDVTGLGITLDGTIAVGRTEGLCVIEPGGLASMHRTEGPAVGRYPGSAFEWGENGALYYPDLEKGLWEYQDGEWSLLTSEDGLATDSTTCVDFDSQGVGWIGSVAGVTRWEGGTFNTFTADDGLAWDLVVGIAIDALDQPWVIVSSYPNYAICHYDGTSWHNHAADEDVPAMPLRIAADTRGWVWIIDYDMTGREYGLCSYNGQNWRRWGPDDGFLDSCNAWLYCDDEGNVFASGTVAVDQGDEGRLAIFDGSTWVLHPFDDYISKATRDAGGRMWLNVGYAYDSDGLRIWSEDGETSVLNVQNGENAVNMWSALATSPEGDVCGLNTAGLECHYMNPNVVAVANAATFAPSDTLSLKYWAENPGGADRELDLYVLITLPTGDSLYLPTLWYDPVVYQTVTIPKETTQSPMEILSFEIPGDLPAGEYTITPWFCNHGSSEQTGQSTPITITIAQAPAM